MSQYQWGITDIWSPCARGPYNTISVWVANELCHILYGKLLNSYGLWWTIGDVLVLRCHRCLDNAGYSVSYSVENDV